MSPELLEKRNELKALSAGFAELIEAGEVASVNEGLIDYYHSLGHKVIKSFNAWKADGFQVKKGSKALLLWGKPQPKKNKEATTTAPPAEGEKEKTFFPLAFVFSDQMVEPSKFLAK